MGIAFVLTTGCTKVENTVKSGTSTTVDKTIIPVPVPAIPAPLFPYEISKFSQYGFGEWQYGNGQAYQKRLDLMPGSYIDLTVKNSAKLMNFFAMTDIHITDKESPAGAIYFGYKGGSISAYSPSMLYTTHFLNATVQTVNTLNQKTPFDFGIALGDLCNNTQYNELRWFIDVFDGKKITPDSGDKDDPVTGPNNDFQDEYIATGINKTIPWYVALGNNDHFWMGTSLVNQYLRDTYIGPNMLQTGSYYGTGDYDNYGYYMGVVDGSTPNGNIIGAGPVISTLPTVVKEDANRRSLLRSEWISEFFNTASYPVGHGFNQANIANGFACYAFEPNENIPIRVIVLDNTQKESDPNWFGFGHGTLDEERYDWLVSELNKGQAEGKLMIIAAHIPIGVEATSSYQGWSPYAFVTEDDLIAKLHTYPNLLMWVSGHRHLNAVTSFASPDASRPELGFWQVETASLREFPQQFRTFTIDRNTDNTISIFATNIDPETKEGSFAAKSRSNAIAAAQIFGLRTGGLSYNAELIKVLSTEMQAKIQNYGTPIQ